MKTEKLLLYLVIGVVAYVLYTKYQTTKAAAVATAAGNSTGGIIAGSLGGIGTILGALPIGGGGDDYDDDDDY
jgi:hypothetical protein